MGDNRLPRTTEITGQNGVQGGHQSINL